jgi:hypothetical protein
VFMKNAADMDIKEMMDEVNIYIVWITLSRL